MSLIQSAKLCGHEPYRDLKDVLQRLPTQPASRIGELMPHRWQPSRSLNLIFLWQNVLAADRPRTQRHQDTARYLTAPESHPLSGKG